MISGSHPLQIQGVAHIRQALGPGALANVHEVIRKQQHEKANNTDTVAVVQSVQGVGIARQSERALNTDVSVPDSIATNLQRKVQQVSNDNPHFAHPAGVSTAWAHPSVDQEPKVSSTHSESQKVTVASQISNSAGSNREQWERERLLLQQQLAQLNMQHEEAQNKLQSLRQHSLLQQSQTQAIIPERPASLAQTQTAGTRVQTAVMPTQTTITQAQTTADSIPVWQTHIHPYKVKEWCFSLNRQINVARHLLL